MAFRISIPAWPDGGDIPSLHTCDGAGLSPAVEWSGHPQATASFALLVEDPDAPVGVWTHWMLWNLKPADNIIRQGIRPGAIGTSGTNDFGYLGYGGPCPPPGNGRHRYYFRVFALSVSQLEIPAGARRAQFNAALEGKVLAEAVYLGHYQRS